MKIYVLMDDYAGYGSRFYAQHGVSYLIQVNGKNILFDTSQEGDPVIHNMKLLMLDADKIDAVFLSHCHYDHTGGLLDILKKISRRIPIIAHPKIFRRNFVLENGLREIGVPFRRVDVEEYANLYLIRDPVEFMPNVFSTGEIRERLEFENTGLNAYTLDIDGNLIADNMMDDMSLYIKVSDGIVVVSGCSHAGIASIVKRATELSDSKKVKAVIGGFHLINANEDRILKTIEIFRRLGVENIYTGHCTGLSAEAYMLKEYNRYFHKLYSGMIINIE